MAPIRRYLRITKHSVLEVRIYLDRPSDAEAWLVKRENPALPRVIQAARPLVLPKLREENERAKGRGKGKKKGVKDVVEGNDFEVSIFLTEHSSRHSVLTKQMIFKDKPRIQSNSGKLTNWLTTGTSEQPMIINDDPMEPIVIREEDKDKTIDLADIPEAGGFENQATTTSSRGKRRRGAAHEDLVSDGSDSDDSFQSETAPNKRNKRNAGGYDAGEDESEEDPRDEKKKLGLNTSYEGFSIYGRILCLVVKRKGARHQGGGGQPISSQQMLENWVSTQAAAEQVDDDEDNG